MKHLLIFASVLALVSPLPSCAGGSGAPSPGYHGDYPSAEGQRAMKALDGRVLVDRTSAFGGGELEVDGFGILPNPVTSKGPVVMLVRTGGERLPMRFGAKQGEDGRWYLPVLTDGDVADFYARVTGEVHPSLSGETSGEYRAVLRIE